jgi:hypothetical protein
VTSPRKWVYSMSSPEDSDEYWDEVATIVVLGMGHEEQRWVDCISYTVNADGSLVIIHRDGSSTEFAVEEWIDVRIEPKPRPA